MFDFHQKRRLRSVLNAPLFQAGLGIIVLLVVLSAYKRFDIAMEMQERREQAGLVSAELERRKEDLEAEVEYLSNERGMEAEIRRQFDVALPGEQVVVIVEDGDEGPEVLPLASTTDEVEAKKRWYQFWR